ncbi:MAG: DUF962 domain-containing protein [Bacteroidia bacterium]|nr:DUF962 domain-containing protein [Bacteroidia bacterium]MCZ2277399.1 DUF962 domain-containing protein [Bacteroidia bacterium]
MKTIHEWFIEYGQSHENGKNKAIHFICVPFIYFSTLGLLSEIPSLSMSLLLPATLSGYAHFGTLLLPFVLLFYVRLSVPLTFGMALFTLICLFLIDLMTREGIQVGLVSLVIFILAWAGQFYGHKLEGKKPSFFKDLQFLLIGPAWVLSFCYNKLGINY